MHNDVPGRERPYLIDFPSSADDRGVLTSIEAAGDIPIKISRIFYMHSMTKDRGGHSHIDTDQVVVLLHGSANLKLTSSDDTTSNYLLDDPCVGLYLPRLTFVEICDPSDDAVCLVLANTHYDMAKSLRTMQDYRAYIVSSENAPDKADNLNG